MLTARRGSLILAVIPPLPVSSLRSLAVHFVTRTGSASETMTGGKSERGERQGREARVRRGRDRAVGGFYYEVKRDP